MANNLRHSSRLGCSRLVSLFWACIFLVVFGQLGEAQTIQGYTFSTNVNEILGLGSILQEISFLGINYEEGTSLINTRFGSLDLEAPANSLYQLSLEFWNDNANYAKDLVTMAYSADNLFGAIHDEPAAREAGALEALRVMVMRSAVSREMDQAMVQCPSSVPLARQHWDRAAARDWSKT